jgi:hypothetical protein
MMLRRQKENGGSADDVSNPSQSAARLRSQGSANHLLGKNENASQQDKDDHEAL